VVLNHGAFWTVRRPRDGVFFSPLAPRVVDTDRLLDRRGFARITAMTAKGAREFIVDKRVAD
jgi:hypothetical protein